MVVRLVAGEVGATRLGAARTHRVQLLDAVVVAGVHNGRDVKVGEAVPSLERNLAEHTGDARGAVRDCVPVADPAVGEVDADTVAAAHVDIADALVAGRRREDDGAASAVLGDEGDRVGKGRGGKSRDESEESSELHFA